jgi:S-formylglutathione hydrolase
MKRVRLLQPAIITAGWVFAVLIPQGPAAGQTATPASAAAVNQAPTPPLKGKIERIKIHGKSLEGNLMGESDSPEVSIYLPPSYLTDQARRFPVIYFLHGYGGTDLQYLGGSGPRLLPTVIERAFASGTASEMIIVVPNCMNAYGGCMYSNSPTTGNWEDYIADDLVAYMDKNYRTIANRNGRGLSGQSMGGYGAVRIGMKRPDVYSAMWAMAPCCLNQGNPSAGRGGQPSPLEAIKTVEQARKGDRGILVGFASAAAWSPNPDNPPFFLDLPTKNGAVVPEVAARYGANSPLAMVSQYAPNLRKYKAVVIDVGREDTLLSSIQQFDARLKQLGVPHVFSVRDGDHGSHVVPQFEQKILPFFSQNLSFEQSVPARR